MRRMLVLGAGLFVAASLTASAARAADPERSGELRDGYCYMTLGAHGASHHDCAMACAKAGEPVMLQLKSGKLVLLLPAKDKSGFSDDVINKMEQSVTVSGHEYSKGGVTVLRAESVK